MSIVARIKKLCEGKNLTLNKLERTLALSKSSVAKWDTNSPSIDKVQKVADYFGVSADYLMGRTPAPNVTEPEQRIEAYDLMPGYGYSDLDDEDKAFVEQQQKLLVEQLLKKKGKK